ncbi:hypothetical protein ISS08_00095 [Candidatus Pacearchaeota archaeon]|nr:hypothetical protein [Candidatus Pacearchaeota archaeon]
MYEKEFEEFGLTKGESKVYLSLLKIGESTVGPIVKNSKVAYSHIYEILERLIQKGLVSYILKEKTKYFQAVNPSLLKEYFKKKKNEIDRQETKFEKILPNLLKLNQTKKESSAEIFVGEKGLLTAYNELIKGYGKTDILRYWYSHDEETYAKLNNFYHKLFPKLKGKIRMEGIANQEVRKKIIKEKLPSFVKAKFVDFPIPSNIDVFKNKILITIWKDVPTAFLITSKEAAKGFISYFDDTWRGAKK